MKRNILFTAILFYCALTINAQKDTLFFIKDGLIVNKQSIKPTDLDSAIFYKPLISSGIDIQTVNIPAVTLASLGSKVTEVGRRDDETPHRATLSAFAMSKYETTNAQYATFLNAKKIGADGLYAKGTYPTEVLIKASSGEYDWGLHYTDGKWIPVAGYENHPVINVSWFGATEFATYVGGFLPTEAEWEYACRGGFNIPVPFYTFDCLSNEDANYFWLYPYNTCTNTITERPGTTLPVGSYAPNEFGLYDMHGNVDEWCSDWYGAYAASSTDPLGALTGDSRVFRGGSWGTKAVNCRSASRDKYSPATINISIGFRVVFYESKASLGNGFVDSRDGNVYPTVTIGNQVWMAENLKYLPQVVGPATASETAPYNYVYDYNGTDVEAAKATENYSDYGVLYNWQAATEACPTGWHLPSDDEWRELTDFIGE
ncbi:MAG TPA: SUMF1/EgtB/PvdO family nonheme iron enzyme, partial [Fermentimonas sp.]|nr:SUMF1/EgtB/PvdO family nonheme iron enzyme [Fermentimonas sp.]